MCTHVGKGLQGWGAFFPKVNNWFVLGWHTTPLMVVSPKSSCHLIGAHSLSLKCVALNFRKLWKPGVLLGVVRNCRVSWEPSGAVGCCWNRQTSFEAMRSCWKQSGAVGSRVNHWTIVGSRGSLGAVRNHQVRTMGNTAQLKVSTAPPSRHP